MPGAFWGGNPAPATCEGEKNMNIVEGGLKEECGSGAVSIQKPFGRRAGGERNTQGKYLRGLRLLGR